MDILRPPDRLDEASAGAWFASPADWILNRSLWKVGRRTVRIAEIEFYFHSPDHPDPFPHCHPLQAQAGRWYFHRSGKGYRGGTFKGLDLTFGNDEAYGGILIRAIHIVEGDRAEDYIEGPSRVVDFLLESTRASKVPELDRFIGGRLAWDAESMLCIGGAPDRGRPVVSCPRVGLSLGSETPNSARARFRARPYRFLIDPARVRKGRHLLTIGLACAGHTVGEIARESGISPRVIRRYLSAFAQVENEAIQSDRPPQQLSVLEECRLLGRISRYRPG